MAFIRSVHEGKKPFKYDVCENSFVLETDLIDHMESVHEGKKSLKCMVCSASFALEDDLKTHTRNENEGNISFCPSRFLCHERVSLYLT